MMARMHPYSKRGSTHRDAVKGQYRKLDGKNIPGTKFIKNVRQFFFGSAKKND